MRVGKEIYLKLQENVSSYEPKDRQRKVAKYLYAYPSSDRKALRTYMMANGLKF